MSSTSNATALHFTKTETGRYAATAGGYRYLVRKTPGGWELTVRRTYTEFGVELADYGHRAEFAEFDLKRDALVIAAEFHALGNDYVSSENGYQSRWSKAIVLGYGRLIGTDAAR